MITLKAFRDSNRKIRARAEKIIAGEYDEFTLKSYIERGLIGEDPKNEKKTKVAKPAKTK